MTFVRVPGNPEPQGAEELWLEGRGGVRLRAMLAPALGQVKGTVLLCPGRTEFIEKYFEVSCELQSRGFVVFVLDWRGQGLSARALSDPQKGHFASFEDPVNDYAIVLRQLADRLPQPHILVAHSMGGAIMLRALQTRRVEVAGALFSAPMWGIKGFTGPVKRFARFMTAVGAGGSFAPGVQKHWKREDFRRNNVTSDRERHARTQGLIAADTRLALGGPTLGWVSAAADTMDSFNQPGSLTHIRCPVVVLSAEREALVDNAAHARLVGGFPAAQGEVIAGSKHEIMMEVDAVRNIFWARFDALAARVLAQAT